jgi:DNA primase
MSTNEIFNQIDLVELINAIDPSLNPKDKGGKISLLCPKCNGGSDNEESGFIYKNNPGYIFCHRQNNCGEKTSLFDLFKEGRGFDNRETVIELKKMAGMEINETTASDSYNNYYFTKKFSKTLFTEKGTDELQYLLNRGYTIDEIKKMGLGAFVLDALNETEKKSLYKLGLGLEGLGDTHTLAIPFKGINGNIIGFSFRSILINEILKERKIQKYKNSYGLKTSAQFFNFNKNSNSETLILVEGYFDALYLTARGIKGVAACGKAIPSDDQLATAVENGISEFIFALDTDTAGMKATKSGIKRLDQMGVTSNVIQGLLGCKDPDELVLEKGVEAFENILAAKVPGYQWLADYIAAPFWNISDTFKAAKKEYFETKSNFNKQIFIEETSTITKMDKDEILADFTRYEVVAKSEKVMVDFLLDKKLQTKLKKYLYKNRIDINELLSNVIDDNK